MADVPAIEDDDATCAEATQLREQLDALGTVNPLAIEELRGR